MKKIILIFCAAVLLATVSVYAQQKTTTAQAYSVSYLTSGPSVKKSKKHSSKKKAAAPAASCANFPDKLAACSPFKCKFKHPAMAAFGASDQESMMLRNITGLKNGKCVYKEQMPNNGLMTCKFPKKDLANYADEYRKTMPSVDAGNMSVNVSADLVSGQQTSSSSPDSPLLQSAMNNGTCVVAGYK